LDPSAPQFKSRRLASFGEKGVVSGTKLPTTLAGIGQKSGIYWALNPDNTNIHCHQQLHTDYGFMTLFDYA
jgi:hypothetical protein